jgi:DNA-binding NarL/FixJ family response regulator
MIRIAIFDDNKVFRDSLLQLFRFTPDIEVVGAFKDCSAVQADITRLQPDVVLMDIDMPGMNGIDATAVVKSEQPDTQVIMLTVSEEEDRVFQALRNGATGYLLKKTGPTELVESIRSVYAGGSPMTPAIARKVLRHFHLGINPEAVVSAVPVPDTNPMVDTAEKIILPSGLTPREQEILEGLIDGLSYKLIAARHYISPETVKNHIQVIYRKLHVNSKGEAISLALRGK